MTLEQFVSDTSSAADASARFANESDRTLRITVDGGVWLRPGAAIAYRGAISFERRPTLASRTISDVVMRETAPLVRAVGRGQLYCAHRGSHVRVIHLAGESIFVSWPDLVAFEETLAFELTLVSHGVGLAAGGLVTVRLTGHGSLAIATHGRPVSLMVTRDQPLSTDPHATLAWSADLEPVLKTDLTWRSLFAHGGHEPVQMFFQGTGFVVVQPFEDPRLFNSAGDAMKRIASLVGA
jgi:uncharacterized protein (AIM24 family)